MKSIAILIDSNFEVIWASKELSNQKELWICLHNELAESLGFGEECVFNDNEVLEDNFACPIFWPIEAIELEAKTVLHDMFGYQLVVVPFHVH